MDKVYDTYFTTSLANNRKLIDNLLRDLMLINVDKEKSEGLDYGQ